MMKVIVAAAASIAVSLSAFDVAMAREESKTVIKPLFPLESKTKTTKATKGPYGDLIARYAEKYGVPAGLAHAVVRIESNFNPKARGRAGEIGLMQIKPATARMLGYGGSANGLYDPETNIRWGMQYLAAAHKLGGGETCQTILKYNAGHGAKRMNPVSKRYCGKVQALLKS